MTNSIDWPAFKAQSKSEKNALLKKNNEWFDVIYADQFDRDWLDELFIHTNQLRKMSKSESGRRALLTLASDLRAMLFFVQPSSRTFLSFQNACHLLGMQTSSIRNPALSSEAKGEQFEDSIRTFSSYVDLIIMRHPHADSAEKAAFLMNAKSSRPVPIINGGAGPDEHPTQALLDLYTISHAFEDTGGIDGKEILFVGDLKRGRTVRSLCQLLTRYDAVKITLASPEAFAMENDMLEYLRAKNMDVTITEDFKSGLQTADVVYMTRIQDEYDTAGESGDVDYSPFYLNQDTIPSLKQNAIVMHPLPRRAEIDPDFDADPRAFYWRQARNGMWVRAALIATLLDRVERLTDLQV